MNIAVQPEPHRPAAQILRAALGDLMVSAVSLGAAFVVAHDFSFEGEWPRRQMLVALPMLLLVKFCIFAAVQQHRRSWRYAGDRDVLAALTASSLASLLMAALIWGGRRLSGPPELLEALAFPNVLLPIDWMLTNLLTVWSRLALRLRRSEGRSVSAGTRKLIVGAGDAGETLLREIQRRATGRHLITGFLDDDRRKVGTRIHGIPVLGPIDDLPVWARTHEIQEVLVAIPSAPQERIARIFEMSLGAPWTVRVVPGLSELIEGPITIESQLRPIRLEDLLPRAPVRLDHSAIEHCLRGQVVMVTGAGGSIGSELCRQITRFAPARLVLVEQAENNLFEIENELQRLAGPQVVRGYLADICDRRRMEAIFTAENPALVCHAAAHKHVPMVEAHPGEGIKNNVLGTQVLADLAEESGVRRFVLISTDKAVQPCSVMGCTKRVAELYLQHLAQRGSSTRFMIVRFGNVLGSTGSVVPIFQKQIARGGPITVTHPEATRYFMTIPEAAQLVLQAGAGGEGGEIFVLEMGAAVRIVDLARQLVRLSGLAPEDIDIVFTGLRPGEKLHEQLFMDGETLGATPHPHIHVCHGPGVDSLGVLLGVDQLADLVDSRDVRALRAALAELVPQYSQAEVAETVTTGR